MLMMCCFTADQSSDHSKEGNYRGRLLGPENPQLPPKQRKSKAFDVFHQEALKQLKIHKEVRGQTESSHCFRESRLISPASTHPPLLERKRSITGGLLL